MSKWKEDIFDNFIKLKRGYDLPEDNIVTGEYPIVASTTIKGYHHHFKATPPGVVTGRSGSLGTVQYIAKKYWPLNTTLYVKDFKGNFPKYVYYFLRTIHLENFNSGAGVPTLNQNHLHKLKIKVPPFPVQKKIAAILSAYDDLIEKNNRRIAILEKMAEEIYREWFVRLRFPGHEQVKFNKGIPEGWERKRFDEFCLLQRGYDLPDAQVIPGQYPVVASTSIKTYHNQFKVNPPVITTGRSGSLGTVLFINSQAWPLNTTLFVKKFYSNLPYLIYYTLKFLKLENFNSGAGVPTLNRNHLGGLYMSIPPKSLQNNFNGKIANIFKQKELLLKSNKTLVETRDRLLTRLISGKLSVENLDIQFPPSMREELDETS